MDANKVEAFGKVLIDLTNDTVTPSAMVQGVTAHDKSGAIIEGELDWDSKQDTIEDLSTIRTNASTGNARSTNILGSDGWNSSTNYAIGNHVIHNNALWRAVVANKNSEPSTSNGNWTLVNLTKLDTPRVLSCTSKLSKINTSNLKIMKMGNVAVLSGYIEVSDGVLTSGMNFCSFPDECLPATGVGMSWYVVAMTASKKCSHVLVGQTSGQGLTLYINETGCSTVVFNGTWITKHL